MMGNVPNQFELLFVGRCYFERFVVAVFHASVVWSVLHVTTGASQSTAAILHPTAACHSNTLDWCRYQHAAFHAGLVQQMWSVYATL